MTDVLGPGRRQVEETVRHLRSDGMPRDPQAGLAEPADTAVADTASTEVERTADQAVFPAVAARGWERHLKAVLLVVDAVALIVGIAIADVFRVTLSTGHSRDNVIALCLLPSWLLLLGVGHTYDSWRTGSAGEEARHVITASLRTAGLIAIACYGLRVTLSRVFLLVAVVCGTLTLLGGRATVRLVLRQLRRKDQCLHRVVAVGYVVDVGHLVEQSQRAAGAGFRIVGACVPEGTDWLSLPGGQRLPVLGGPTDAGVCCRSVRADVLAIVSDAVLDRGEMRRLAWELESTDTRLLVAPRLTDVAGPRISVRPLAGLPLLHVEQPRFSGLNRMVKAVSDRMTAAAALVVLSPVFLIVTLAIRLDSRGRAFYHQQRVGLDGRLFTCWKLRTMFSGADERQAELQHLNEHTAGLLFKIRNDPRVTRVGALLRRTSIDELPQLWNVVKGEMSLVGPRPPLPHEADGYEQDVRRRLLVKPGLTGLWQVSGRADLSWEESVRLDLFYVENWSPALDLAILARTVLAVITRRGAY
jgi:exopolysaccharide biosynthesis polyprenyl glycosylphosphotransferase